MSLRFESLAGLLRRLLLGAFYAGGALIFWLPSHEVFEGPKVQATLIYALALAVLGLPLLAGPGRRLWVERPLWAKASLGLVAATALSILGAYASLPANLLLAVEHIAPVLAAALAALLFYLENPAERRRILFLFSAAHILLLFYGLVQVLDQNWGQAHAVVVDLIRWTQFGQSRVYSSMGNPDYMAAHLTLLLPLWAGLGHARVNFKLAAQSAAVLLLATPLLLIPAVYGFGATFNAFIGVMGPWALLCVALFFGFRRLNPKQAWLVLMGMVVLLVILAQGRGAYLAMAVSALVMLVVAGRVQGRAWFLRRRSTLLSGVRVAGIAAGLVALLLIGRALSPETQFFRQGSAASVLKAVDSMWARLTVHAGSQTDAQVVRKFYWKAAGLMGAQHPIVGVGFGNHAIFTARAQSQVWKAMEAEGSNTVTLVEPHVELYTHNDFLQNWAETGAVGLLAFLFFWWVYFKDAWRQAREENPALHDLALGLIGLGVALVVNALINFPWRVLATQQLCWLAMALVGLGARYDDKQASASAPMAALPSKLLLGALAVATLLALYPTRWFMASNLFKQGNVRKDNPAQQAQAAPFYEKAVRIGLSGTQEVELYLYLGSMYNVLGRSDLAVAYFQKGLEVYPDFLEALYNLGFTYQSRYAQSQDPADLKTARDYYERLLDVNPRYLSALNNLGNIQYMQKEFVQAVETYKMLTRFGPQMVEGHYNLGACHIMLGDLAAALDSFETALKVKPDYAPALEYVRQLKALPKGSRVKVGG